MKWFKHYVDASRSEKLAALREKTGLEGYARYWLLVEFLAEKFDGNNTEFIVNRKTLGRHLGYYRPTMARHWLDIGHTLGLFQVSLSGQCQVNDDLNYLIVFPKLLEIKDNHTRNLQVTSKSLAPRKEKKRIDKNICVLESSKRCVNKFNIDDIYAVYPRKQGKAAGVKKLNGLIKTQEQFDLILQGAKNYAKYVERSKTEKQYIKQFSSWVNQESWNDVLDIPMTEAELEQKFKEL